MSGKGTGLDVAVLGLGEAGGRLAADLADAGARVRGYDPDPARGGSTSSPEEAVTGADVVLSANAASAALAAAQSAVPALGEDAGYADLNTSSPGVKQDLAAIAGERFADVALLGPVPEKGLRTPALASGPAAEAFAAALRPLGMPVQVVSDRAGDAAEMKLLRSVFMKGLAASAIESLDAAERAGHDVWLRGEIAGVIGEPLLDRLLEGSRRHAVRRAEEMDAAREVLVHFGVEPRIASASAALLSELAGAGRG